MTLFLLTQEEKIHPLFIETMLILLIVFIVGVVLWHFSKFVEIFWVEYLNPKPLFNHFYIRLRKLSSNERFILKTQFAFYQKLNRSEQKYFEHRVARYIKFHRFKGRNGLQVDDQKRVLIAATAVMLTFGYRDYMVDSVDRFLIYPGVFYSTINKAHHKGEFNPGYKAIIFSWEDFMQGYNIDNDNFNLGIHELVHAMHFDYLKQNSNSISAIIFMQHYNKLKAFLNENDMYKNNLVASKYLRNYAYTNNFEFIAVLIEAFFETPLELKTQFPEIYDHVRKMLNFKQRYLQIY